MNQPRCLVIGASGVLGSAVVRELARRDARVVGTFHTNEAKMAELGKEIPGFVARRLDLADAAETERVVEALGKERGGIDALVHCATVASASRDGSLDRLDTIDSAALAHMLAVNVSSPIFCARAMAALRLSRSASRMDPSRDRAANIVLVGSIDGVKPVPTAVPYATSKGALVALARALAKELGKERVLVNVLAPGLMESGASRLVPAQTKDEYLKHSAMKRFGKVDEVARSIAWLALSNTYVTGQTIVVDGGL